MKKENLPEVNQTSGNENIDWQFDKLEKEYSRMPSPESWKKSHDTSREVLYFSLIYVVWLILVIVFEKIMHDKLGANFWLLSIVPLILICVGLFNRLRQLEFTLYKLEWGFHLRKKLRELAKKRSEEAPSSIHIYQATLGRIGWIDYISLLDFEDETMINDLITSSAAYKTKIIEIPFIRKEKDWKKIYPMGAFEYEVLEYVKKHKGFTPGDVNDHFKIGYANATHAIDTLYAHGYVDQPAFYWQKGEIKYTGKQIRLEGYKRAQDLDRKAEKEE